MPFDRPTLSEISNNLVADIEADLPGADARLRRSVLNVLAAAFAGSQHGLYGFIDFISLQVFPDTAEAEFLDRWSAIWGVARNPSVAASGSVTLTGINGSVIPTATVLQRGDGVRYATTAEATIAAGSATVAVSAETPGASGNSDAATVLNLLSPVDGVQSAAVVAAGGLALGLDEEADAALLSRLLDRIQTPPHGGNKNDYLTWAVDTAGHGVDVTRAWVAGLEDGPGTVTVRFMMDDTYSDGIPLAADISDVQDFIDTARPVTANVTVAAPEAVPLAFEISGLSPNADAIVQAAIVAELTDLIRREAEPGGTLLISHIREAISIAAGEVDHVLVSPSANVVVTAGQITTFDDVTWS